MDFLSSTTQIFWTIFEIREQKVDNNDTKSIGCHNSPLAQRILEN